MANLRNNFIYQTLYQLLATAIPLITSPYLSRVLGAEQLGVYSYISTVANYFTVLASLGIGTHATRYIAACSSEERDIAYREIRCLQIFLSSIMSLAYVLFVALTVTEHCTIYYIQVIWIIATGIDVTWYFGGLQEFKITVTRNLIIKIITILGIFTLVKSKEDVAIYALMLTLGTLGSNAYLIIMAHTRVKKCKIRLKGVLKHLKPAALLFVPFLGMTVYHQMDKVMLGSIGTYSDVGLYYNADKIVNILIGIITGFGTVSMPRVTQLLVNGDMKEYEMLLKKSVSLIMFICSACVFGISAVSSVFVPLFFGEEFVGAIPLVSILSFVMYFKAGSTIARSEYLIPMGFNKIYIYSTFLGALVNLVANYLFITRYGALGAAYGTMAAEAFVTIYQFHYMNKSIDIFNIIASNWIYVCGGLIMYAIVRLVPYLIDGPIVITLLIQIAVGGIIFFAFCIVVWNITKDKIVWPIVRGYLRKVLDK